MMAPAPAYTAAGRCAWVRNDLRHSPRAVARRAVPARWLRPPAPACGVGEVPL